MKVAILGGTRGMGRSLARLMAARGDAIVLLGRGSEDREKSVADLKARSTSGAVISSVECDLEKPDQFRGALDAAEAALGGLEVVVITAAFFRMQDELEADPALTQKLLTIDFANTVTFCEVARVKLLSHGGGTLCAFSSVAGDRGRKPTFIYGAAKAGLSAYLEGLDHKFRSQGLKTVCVKPGFVRTQMTEGHKVPPFAGEADDVAATVLVAIDRGTPVVYAPPVWRAVMTVIKAMPRFVMRRVGF